MRKEERSRGREIMISEVVMGCGWLANPGDELGGLDEV